MLKDAKNILIINLKYIGDTIWMYPFIKNLKLNLPGARITALINEGGEPLLKLMPELEEVLVIRRKEIKGKGGLKRSISLLKEIRAKRFDTVFVLSNSDRSTFIAYASGAKRRIGFVSDSRFRGLFLTQKSKWDHVNNPHLVEYNLQLIKDSGLEIRDRALVIKAPEEVRLRLMKRLSIKDAAGKKTVIIHPGARLPLRQWGAGNFIKVINALGRSCRIFLCAAPAEKETVEDVLKGLERRPDVVTTDLSLIELAALCGMCDLFIGNDSAPIHIAAAAGIHVIGVYGPTLARHCAPWTENKTLFDDESIPCKLCKQDRCHNEVFQKCFEHVRPEMVIEKAREILSAV